MGLYYDESWYPNKYWYSQRGTEMGYGGTRFSRDVSGLDALDGWVLSYLPSYAV